jgi:transposase-like protein
MSLRVVSMAELRLEVLLEPERTGDSVAEVCRRRGISRDTFYEVQAAIRGRGGHGPGGKIQAAHPLAPTDRYRP